MIKVLELFAGSRSIGKVADELGYEVFSIDIEPFEGINLVQDMEFIERSQIPFIPDIIWASPPCTSYSIAAISHHRKGQVPVSDFAKKSDRVILATINLIQRFPNATFYIENPVGMLRKMWFMQQFDRATVIKE